MQLLFSSAAGLAGRTRERRVLGPDTASRGSSLAVSRCVFAPVSRYRDVLIPAARTLKESKLFGPATLVFLQNSPLGVRRPKHRLFS